LGGGGLTHQMGHRYTAAGACTGSGFRVSAKVYSSTRSSAAVCPVLLVVLSLLDHGCRHLQTVVRQEADTIACVIVCAFHSPSLSSCLSHVNVGDVWVSCLCSTAG
jgi:hypothetical protein